MTDGKEQRRFGLVVGVSEFVPDEGLSNLPFAANDARRVYETLRDFCGFESRDLCLLASVDSAQGIEGIEVPNRANILNSLNRIISEANDSDLIFIYIASHGVEVSKTPYLLTADTRMDVVKGTAIDTNEINRTLDDSEAKCIVRVFDACRDTFAKTRSINGRMTGEFQNACFPEGHGWATVSSCSSGEFSYEFPEFKQGVFSYFLCEGIQGKAANPEGKVTIESLVDYLKISLSNWSESQGVTQTPHFRSDISGIVVLSSRPQMPEEPTTVAPIHPLSHLKLGIRDALAATAPDARNLQFTSQEDLRSFAGSVVASINALLSEFSDPTFTVSANPPKENQFHSMPSIQQRFNEKTQRCKVSEEFSNQQIAIPVLFTSNKVVVPSSTLTIVSARFNFFYWLFLCTLQYLGGLSFHIF